MVILFILSYPENRVKTIVHFHVLITLILIKSVKIKFDQMVGHIIFLNPKLSRHGEKFMINKLHYKIFTLGKEYRILIDMTSMAVLRKSLSLWVPLCLTLCLSSCLYLSLCLSMSLSACLSVSLFTSYNLKTQDICPPIHSIKELTKINWEALWNPKLEIYNVRGEAKQQIWKEVQFGPGGEAFVLEKRRTKGVFAEPMELQEFPFDIQVDINDLKN